MKISIGMMGTGQQFLVGHKIRFEVTSSAFPSVAPNYNTGESAWEEQVPIVAQQTVYHSTEHPSCVRLPVLSYADLRGRLDGKKVEKLARARASAQKAL